MAHFRPSRAEPTPHACIARAAQLFGPQKTPLRLVRAAMVDARDGFLRYSPGSGHTPFFTRRVSARLVQTSAIFTRAVPAALCNHVLFYPQHSANAHIFLLNHSATTEVSSALRTRCVVATCWGKLGGARVSTCACGAWYHGAGDLRQHRRNRVTRESHSPCADRSRIEHTAKVVTIAPHRSADPPGGDPASCAGAFAFPLLPRLASPGQPATPAPASFDIRLLPLTDTRPARCAEDDLTPANHKLEVQQAGISVRRAAIPIPFGYSFICSSLHDRARSEHSETCAACEKKHRRDPPFGVHRASFIQPFLILWSHRRHDMETTEPGFPTGEQHARSRCPYAQHVRMPARLRFVCVACSCVCLPVSFCHRAMESPGWDDALAFVVSPPSGAGADDDSEHSSPPDVAETAHPTTAGPETGGGWGDAVGEVMSCTSSDTHSASSGDDQGLLALALREELPSAGGDAEPLRQLQWWLPFARSRPDDALDDVAMGAAAYWTKDKQVVGSTEMQAGALGTHRKDVAALRPLVAAACVELAKVQWHHLEETLGAPPHNVSVEYLTYVEFVTYDGVDLRLRTSARVTQGQGAEGDVAWGQLHADTAVADPHRVPVDWEAKDWTTGTSKLLNSESAVWMHLRIDGKDVFLHADFPACLQALHKNTAECIKAAALNLVDSSSFRDRFRRRIRLSVTDAAAPNLKAERSILAERPSWHGLHLLCHVHVWARIHGRVFKFCDETTSGMIAVTLSLSDAGHMSLFRAAFRQVLAQDLEIIREPPSPEAVSFRNLILDEFFGHSADFCEHRLILSRLAGGDWRQGGTFQYLATGSERREDILERLFCHLVPCLAGHIPEMFPRQRWSGTEEALRDLGLMANIHGLLERVLCEFFESNFGRIARKPAPPDPLDRLDPAQGDAEHDKPVHMSSSAETPDWAAINRANRGKALQWVTGGSVACDLVCMSIVASPMVRALRAEIDLSSAASRTKQAAAAASAGEGVGIDPLSSCRWPILVAARGEIEERFFRELEDVQAPSRYEAFPDDWRTVEVRNRLFRMVSRQGAAAHELVATVNKQYPYKLMRLAVEPEVAGEIEASCESSLDGYSSAFLKAFAGQLNSSDALAELSLLVLASRTNTVKLESLNATIRRHLTVMSVQTKKPSLATVSSEFMLGQLRRRAVELSYPAGHPLHWARRVRGKAGKLKGGGAAAIEKKRRGGGGPWRAFVSSRCRGVAKALFKALGAEYRALSPADKVAFQELGALGTLAHRHGGTSFGLAARALGAELAKDDFAHRAAQFKETDVVPYATSSKALAIPSAEFVSKLRRCAADVRVFRKIKRQSLQSKAEALCAWGQREGIVRRDSLMCMLPGLARHVNNFSASPFGRGVLLIDWNCRCDLEVPRFAGLRKHDACAQVFNLLSARWARKHDLLFHHSLPPLESERAPAASTKPSCLLAKICLCGHFGDEVWRLKRWLCSSLKRMLPGKWKDELAGGNIVLCLRLSSARSADVSSETAWDACSFSHVSLLYESPFRPTLRKLIRVGGDNHAPGGKLLLRATHQYVTFLELLQDQLSQEGYDEVASWQVRCYKISGGHRPLVAIDPALVEVEVVPGAEDTKHFKQRRHDPACAGDADLGWGLALADVGEDGGNDDISDEEESGEKLVGDSSDSHNASGPDYSQDDASGQGGDSDMEVANATSADAGGDDGVGLAGDSDVDVLASSSQSSSSSSASSSSSTSSSSSSHVAPQVRGQDVARVAPRAPPIDPAGEVEQPAGARAARAGAADAELIVPGGILRFYKKSNQVVAHCEAHGLQACRLSRTFNKSSRRGREGQGRPLGLVFAWLSAASNPDLGSAQDHIRMQPLPDRASRLEARRLLQQIEGSQAFFGQERGQGEDESEEEPLAVP